MGAAIPYGVYERQCHTCSHAERTRIEFRLANGAPCEKTAREFNLSPEALKRHWKLHVTPMKKVEMLAGKSTMANLAERSRAEDRSLLDYYAILRSSLMKVFLEARDQKQAYECALIASRLLNVLEATGRLTGELREHAASIGATVNVINGVAVQPVITMSDPEVARLQAAAIRALRPFPEARAAYIAAMDALAQEGPPVVRPASPGNGHCEPPLQIEGHANG